ncbi:hypothetical protein BGZ72_007152 [Mortierella alpina]|nr:hypothetical protein BGZ72_007152 [Mortierella alpina]
MKDALSHASLRTEFNAASERYTLLQKAKREAFEAERRTSPGALSQADSSHIRYRTVDRPPPTTADTTLKEHPALARTRIPPRRKRYSPSKRTVLKSHPAPKTMVRYKRKPYTQTPESPLEKKPPKPAKRKETKTRKTITAKSTKVDLTRAMSWEHPTITLDVGTVSANVGRALGEADLAAELLGCLQEITRLASEIKRQGQQLIGRYIEYIFAQGDLTAADKRLLDYLCPRVTSGTKDDSEDDQDQEEDDIAQADDTAKFYNTLLIHIYSGNPIVVPTLKPGQPPNKSAAWCVKQFIDRVAELGLLQTNDPGATNITMPYPGSSLLRSVSTEMSTEIKRHYRNGSTELVFKLEKKKKKGLLVPGMPTAIDNEIPAIENFVLLNRTDKNSRRIVPLTSFEQPFVSFSERELGILFWKNPVLKEQLRAWVLEDLENASFQPAQHDVNRLLQRAAPGELITRLLSNVGRDEPRHGRRTYKDTTTVMDQEEISVHIQNLRREGFNPADYDGSVVRESGDMTKKCRYVLRGTIRTDGHRLQLLAFKTKVLQSVKFKRFPPEILPPRLTSTVGGVDYYLSEVRNIVRTEQDVADLWGCPAEEIKILALDLGQTCVVGAYARIPKASDSKNKEGPIVFNNLAVKQKAVLQPTFKHRRWVEQQKNQDPGNGHKAISEIESELPPLLGEDASVTAYIDHVQTVKVQLDRFYNGRNRYKKHRWDMRRARQEEYNRIADQLLKMVGGSIGQQRDPANKVIIGIGLGKFSSQARLTSLHTSFQSFFVQKARALGYIVTGVNEFYSSKKCPRCQNFVAQVEIRRLYCPCCKSYVHRDVLAAHNLSNVIFGHLKEQTRPLYLQPVDDDGHYPWMANTKLDAGVGAGVGAGPGPGVGPGGDPGAGSGAGARSDSDASKKPGQVQSGFKRAGLPRESGRKKRSKSALPL